MSKIDDLKKIYNLASELRFALIQALNNNEGLHYAKISFTKDMKSIQGVGEWAMANMQELKGEDENRPKPE